MEINLGVLVFALASSVVTARTAGLAPAVQSLCAADTLVTGSNGRSVTAGRLHSSAVDVLVPIEGGLVIRECAYAADPHAVVADIRSVDQLIADGPARSATGCNGTTQARYAAGTAPTPSSAAATRTCAMPARTPTTTRVRRASCRCGATRPARPTMSVPSARRAGLRNGPCSGPRQTPPAAVAPPDAGMGIAQHRRWGVSRTARASASRRMHSSWHLRVALARRLAGVCSRGPRPSFQDSQTLAEAAGRCDAASSALLATGMAWQRRAQRRHAVPIKVININGKIIIRSLIFGYNS